MPSYDAAHFNPPAPVAQVMLRNPHSGATVFDVLLLVDTGADITLLPRIAIEQLGVPLLAVQRYELMVFDGNKSFTPVVISPRTKSFIHLSARKYCTWPKSRREMLN
jgi:hypothetical protein